jgi:hypothetical protein
LARGDGPDVPVVVFGAVLGALALAIAGAATTRR